MPEQAKASFFTCRICGHNEFKEVLADFNRDMVVGATIPVKYCKCANCSVVFEDPELFSSTPFDRTVMAAEAWAKAFRESGVGKKIVDQLDRAGRE